MCRLSSAQYDLYRRTNSGLRWSLFGWLRDLWRQPKPQTDEGKVVRFPAEASAHVDQKPDHRTSKAA